MDIHLFLRDPATTQEEGQLMEVQLHHSFQVFLRIMIFPLLLATHLWVLKMQGGAKGIHHLLGTWRGPLRQVICLLIIGEEEEDHHHHLMLEEEEEDHHHLMLEEDIHLLNMKPIRVMCHEALTLMTLMIVIEAIHHLQVPVCSTLLQLICQFHLPVILNDLLVMCILHLEDQSMQLMFFHHFRIAQQEEQEALLHPGDLQYNSIRLNLQYNHIHLPHLQSMKMQDFHLLLFRTMLMRVTLLQDLAQFHQVLFPMVLHLVFVRHASRVVNNSDPGSGYVTETVNVPIKNLVRLHNNSSHHCFSGNKFT
jgi:hypothetical protein